ncbi:MAG: hypothetical protein ACPGWR_10335 [Ardenticatenaceae bacterium]
MSVYSIYGVTFTTTLTFRSPLPPSSRAPELTVTEQYGAIPLEGAQLLSTLAEEYWIPAAIKYVYRFPTNEDLLLFPGGDQILISQKQMTYVHAGNHRERFDWLDVRMLGSGFAWWLLRQGKVPFHAGAIMVDGEAVLFLAESRTGKSSLMCSFLAKGYALLCDDLVAVEQSAEGQIMAMSAYPQMRMWPTTIEQFIGTPDPFLSVIEGGVKRRVPIGKIWGRFLEGAFAVSRIYLLKRREEDNGPIQVRPLLGHEAFMALLSGITMVSVFPLSESDNIWLLLEKLVQQVPLYELSYPSGWQWLPTVHEAILEPKNLMSEACH